MEPKDQPSRHIASRRVGPIVFSAVALILYLVSLNRWVTFGSVDMIARITGADWRSVLPFPVTHLLTYPFRWLPAGVQPSALNILSAVLGAAVLYSLARTVFLLPQCKTREQRSRLRGGGPQLEGSWAWMPPIAAVAALGFQLTFWENSVGFTGETLDLLFFALAIQALAEYRASGSNKALFLGGFVYALGMTNNWGMLGFAPLYAIAILTLKRLKFFDFNFLVPFAGWSFLGLLAYLIVPTLVAADPANPAGFGEALLAQIGSQKNLVLSRQLRLPGLLLSFASVIPALFMTIRWPATFGDMSRSGILITNILFHLAHGIFLLAPLFIFLDLAYSPRVLAPQIPFLTYYYLAAISIGYYTGYFVLLFTQEADRRVRRRKSSDAPSFVALGITLLLVFGTPIYLVAKNWTLIQSLNNPTLRDYATAKARSIPDANALVLSDIGPMGQLVAVASRTDKQAEPFVSFPSAMISSPRFYKTLGAKYPDLWQGVSFSSLSQGGEAELPLEEYLDSLDADAKVTDQIVLSILAQTSDTRPLYYLNPSIGFFFESFYQIPNSSGYAMGRYEGNQTQPAALSAATLEANASFWDERSAAWKSGIERLRATRWPVKEENQTFVDTLANWMSADANTWGHNLQINGALEPAKEAFELALALAPENQIATVNLAVNQRLAEGAPGPTVYPQELAPYLERWIEIYGPVDHSILGFELATKLQNMRLYRQAARFYDRAVELYPNELTLHLARASHYLEKAALPEKARECLSELRQQFPTEATTAEQETLIQILEAWVDAYQGELQTAIDKLETLATNFPRSQRPLKAMAEIYWRAEDLDQAIATLDRQLAAFPGLSSALVMKSALLIKLNRHADAIPFLEAALSANPQSREALINLGLAYMETEDWEKAKTTYQSLLRVAPTLNDARVQLARAAAKLGETATARRQYREFLERTPAGTELEATVEAELQAL